MASQHPHRKELDQLAALLAFTEEDLRKGDISFKLEHIEPYYFLVIASWIKAVKTSKSILLLSENGLSRDAEALLRVLVEGMINLHYLSHEDQDNRTRWYADFLAISNKKMDGVIKGSKRLKSISDKITPNSRREIQRQYEEAMQRRSSGRLTLIQKTLSRLVFFRKLWPGAKTWSGHSAEVMAKKVGLHNFYDLVYRLASESIHGTDLMRHLELVDEANFDMSKGVKPVMYPDHSVTRETLVSAILALHLILVSVYTSLQHPRLAELNALFEKIKDGLPRPDDAAIS